MSQHFDTEKLRALPVTERLRLIEELWDSIEEVAAELPVPEWQRLVLDERLRHLDDDGAVGASWPEVRKRISRKS